jgi:hypothetical protein
MPTSPVKSINSAFLSINIKWIRKALIDINQDTLVVITENKLDTSIIITYNASYADVELHLTGTSSLYTVLQDINTSIIFQPIIIQDTFLTIITLNAYAQDTFVQVRNPINSIFYIKNGQLIESVNFLVNSSYHEAIYIMTGALTMPYDKKIDILTNFLNNDVSELYINLINSLTISKSFYIKNDIYQTYFSKNTLITLDIKDRLSKVVKIVNDITSYNSSVQYILNNINEDYKSVFYVKNALNNKVDNIYNMFNILESFLNKNTKLVNVLEDQTNILQDNVAYGVFLNGENITGFINSLSINMDINNYINTIDLAFYTSELYHKMTQYLKSGQDVLSVNINGDIYKFLVEDLDIIEDTTNTFSLWGRSIGAKLGDQIYTHKKDYDYAGNISVHTLLSELCGSLSIELDFDDFYLNGEALSQTNSLPLDIIRKIIQSGGLVMISKPDGTLLFRLEYISSPFYINDYIDFTNEYSYNDNIININIDYNAGDNYNAVLVNGYQKDLSGNSIVIELDNVRNNGQNEFNINDLVFVRVYFVGDIQQFKVLINTGLYSYLGKYTEQITEELNITEGDLNVKYPILSLDSIVYDGSSFTMPTYTVGYRDLHFDFDNTKVSIANVTYTTEYLLFVTTRDSVGKILFYITEEGD